ncbi:PASTA domain-containing protein [Caulobacter endophyticus]|uniref:PASTA domain-containing protein n=1 Tax=Caulobacter endophyticus TaxID=2172652 RepID=UPI002410AC43|nr:PASTA domain-containing protein [Caulobacter endophyticus]MDG2528601.1 PASTA domain-containing protein [Caulobacter endophyticus]
MSQNASELLSESLATPLGEVIAAVGRGVAEAQAALDQASLAATLAMYESDGDEGLEALRSIGYQPTFYVLPETTCEVQVSMQIGGTGGADGSAGTAGQSGAIGKARTYVTPVDAAFQQRYAFQASGAAKLTFKIVPVPPPAALDDAAPMPDVRGLTGEKAVAALSARGFTAAFVDAEGATVTAENAADQTVASQDATPKALVRTTNTVTLGLK